MNPCQAYLLHCTLHAAQSFSTHCRIIEAHRVVVQAAKGQCEVCRFLRVMFAVEERSREASSTTSAEAYKQQATLTTTNFATLSRKVGQKRLCIHKAMCNFDSGFMPHRRIVKRALPIRPPVSILPPECQRSTDTRWSFDAARFRDIGASCRMQ